nr:sialate O-acetylesterase [Bacteroides sp. UBA939]
MEFKPSKLKLPAVLSDGMVFQRERPIKIWGTADKGESVQVRFSKNAFPDGVKGGKLKNTYTATADENGKWMVTLPAMKAGGPYDMEVNDLRVKDILVGDVWLCSGQSNMELTVARVADMFGKETAAYANPMIRYVKTPYGNDLHGPKEDIERMNWTSLTPEAAQTFAALPYFFAIEMYNETKVPVGIVNSSWGGSSVEAWMSEDALQAFPKNLRERDIYNSDEYKALVNRAGGMMSRFWNLSLYKGDEGLHAPVKWYESGLDDSDWEAVNMFSNQLGSKNGYPVSGSHWFRQHIRLTPEQAGKDAILRLGCMVNADSVYVNGVFVGTTSYQYPPRIYKVPASVLRNGENLVTVRLINSGGRPGFVKDKPYCMAIDGDTVRLSEQWKYRLGCEMPAGRGGVSFQNIPTGMYNSMISPLRNLTFKGALWYQGETNAGRPNEYEALLSAMLKDWREKLADENLPFFIMQLPNFMQAHHQPVESGWAGMREAQRQVTLKLPNTSLVVTIDLGEWNDIHPLNKKELARRTALQVRKKVYGQNIVYSGPLFTTASVADGKVILSFEEGTDELMPVNELKGFALAGKDGRFRWAEATVEGNKVIVSSKDVPQPVKVRYAWDDNPQDANLKNTAGLPASPFQVVLGE